MARAGLRRGEVCGVAPRDVHLLADSRALGYEVARARLHVVRREGQPEPSMTTDEYLGRQVASTRAADVLESLG